MEIEKIAFNRGFRITVDGICLNPKGAVRGSKKIDGYFSVKLRLKERSSVTLKFHRLQAFQKYGEAIFKRGIVVRHLNGNPEDNSWENIAIGTYSENMMDIPEQQRISHAKIAASYLKKYNNQEIKDFYNNEKSYKKTMEKFGISSKGTLNYILKS